MRNSDHIKGGNFLPQADQALISQIFKNQAGQALSNWPGFEPRTGLDEIQSLLLTCITLLFYFRKRQAHMHLLPGNAYFFSTEYKEMKPMRLGVHYPHLDRVSCKREILLLEQKNSLKLRHCGALYWQIHLSLKKFLIEGFQALTLSCTQDRRIRWWRGLTNPEIRMKHIIDYYILYKYV